MEAGKHNYYPKQLHERAELLTQQPVCKAEVPRQTRGGHTRYMVKIGVEGREEQKNRAAVTAEGSRAAGSEPIPAISDTPCFLGVQLPLGQQTLAIHLSSRL